MEFHIVDEELQKLTEWAEKHNKECPVKNSGTIGGRITYTFTPTSLGMIVKVKCACGENTDLTNYEDW